MANVWIKWPGREPASLTSKGFPELQSRLVAASASASLACCWRSNSSGLALEDCFSDHESGSRNYFVFSRPKVERVGAAVPHHKGLETLIVVPDGSPETLAMARDCKGLEGHGHRPVTLASVGRAQTLLEEESLWVGDHDYSQPGEASPAEPRGRCGEQRLAANGRDECREPTFRD